jgi:long-chain acyl-CoA synthetase
VPLYVDDNADNLAWCIADVEAKLVIVETARQAGALGRSAEPAGTPSAIVVLRATDDEADRVGATPVGRFLPECDATPIARALPERTLATVCYTSGTGGRPKGVMLSHGNVIANVESCAATDLARPDDRFLSCCRCRTCSDAPAAAPAVVAGRRGGVRAASPSRGLATQRQRWCSPCRGSSSA